MSDLHDLSFCELRAKEVVNTADGKRLGRITDIVFSSKSGCIKGIIVPLSRRGFFVKSQDIYIPWDCVQKVGEDVIIVNLFTDGCGHFTCRNEREHEREHEHDHEHCEQDEDEHKECRKECKRPQSGKPNCDGRCEKCMLFDCSYRWKEAKRCERDEPDCDKDDSDIYVDNKKYKR